MMPDTEHELGARPYAVIFGATSVVGRHLARRLAERGFEGVCFSRRERPARHELPSSFVWRTISEGDRPSFPACAIVFSLAPIPALPALLDRTTGANRLIALSTSSVYFKAQSSDPDERHLAQTLKRSESEVRTRCTDRAIAWTIFRPTLVYDPGHDRNITAIATFARRFGVFPVTWPGTGSRQPIHADDVAQAMVAAARTPEATGAIFDLPGGETLTYRTMVRRTIRSSGRRPVLLYLPLGLARVVFGAWRATHGRAIQRRQPGTHEHGPHPRPGSRAGGPRDHVPAVSSGTSAPAAHRPRTVGVGRAPVAERARRLRFPITAIAVVGLGALVALAVGVSLYLGLSSATENTGRLMAQRSESLVDGLEQRIASQLQPVVRQARWAVEQIERGNVKLEDTRALNQFILGALGAVPQVEGIAITDPRALNRRWSASSIEPLVENWSGRPRVAEWIEAGATLTGPTWQAPFWTSTLGTTILLLDTPIRIEETFAGLFSQAVTISDLSRHIALVGAETGVIPFILHGRDHVLAHPLLISWAPSITDQDQPLVTVEALGDPVLERIWSPDHSELYLLGGLTDASASGVTVGGDYYVFLYRDIDRYGPEPWTIGAYVNTGTSDVGEWLADIVRSALSGSFARTGTMEGNEFERVVASVVAGARRPCPFGRVRGMAGRPREPADPRARDGGTLHRGTRARRDCTAAAQPCGRARRREPLVQPHGGGTEGERAGAGDPGAIRPHGRREDPAHRRR